MHITFTKTHETQLSTARDTGAGATIETEARTTHTEVAVTMGRREAAQVGAAFGAAVGAAFGPAVDIDGGGCPICAGTGKVQNADGEGDCPACGGSGNLADFFATTAGVAESLPEPAGLGGERATCPACGGSGIGGRCSCGRGALPCPACNGEGKVRQ